MATLIQSKQIQGVVTASVVSGEFQVSGSTNLTGSVGVQGSLTATSFTGDGSQLTFNGTGLVSGSQQVIISQVSGYNTFSSSLDSRLVSASQTLSISGDQLSISNGNTITIPTGSGGGASTWNELSGIPTGLISGSTFTDFSSSVDSRIDGISAGGVGADWNTNLQNIPVGLVSGSTQITNGSGILSGSIESLLPSGVVSGSSQITNGSGILSGSIESQLPSGTISGSAQITALGFVSESLTNLGGTNVLSSSTNFETYSSSVDSRIDTEKTRIDNILSGANADYDQFVEIVDLVNSTDTTNDIAFANHYTSSRQRLTSLENFTQSIDTSIKTKLNTDGVLSGSIESLLPSGTISGSTQITNGSGIFSGSLVAGTNVTINQDGNNFIISSSASGDTIPAGTISGSAQITSLGFISESNFNGSGVISGSVLRPNGDDVVSGSVLRTLDGTGVISGSVLRPNGDDVVSGSVLRTLDGTGVISGSVLRPNGDDVVSGSVLRTLNGTGVFSGSLVAGTNITINQDGNNFEISSSASGGSTSVTVSDSAPNSPSEGDLWWKSNDGNLYVYYDGYWVISNDITAGLPAGVVSGSDQITSVITDAYISASAASSGFGSGGSSDFNSLTNVPSGLVSGSSQITSLGFISESNFNGSGVVSGSVLRPNGDDVISGSAQITALGFATTGSNTFKGNQIISGSLLPESSDSFSLGSVEKPWQELYIASSSIKFVSGSNVLTTINSETDAIRIGNILITTESIAAVDNNGSIISTIARATNNGGGGNPNRVEQLVAPEGTISGSAQITALGFISESNFNGSGVVSGSVLRPNGDSVVSGSVVRTLDGTSVISGSAQITALGFISESTFDGDRIVSNTDLPSGVYNNNFGTSGSVQDFLNAVFFPNSAPSISTGNQTIQEFSGSSSTIVTLSGTDAEGQSLTWGTASAYTDDLVRVASNGVMTLNATATSASFNTDLISGTTYGHLVTVTATDTFAAETEKDIYIIVTPNEAPKFRETSIAGNVITSVTQAVNENSSDNTLIKRIYFTDSESDSITITSSSISPANHFSITKSSTYVDIRQNTGSLDYENITQYTFSITASDEHYPAQDSNAVTTLPITINVTDNIVPSISNQTISGLNENSSNGASAGTISASDNEGDSITFVSFDLHKLLLDGSTVTSGSYGGTSQATDPHENPFQMDSSGNVTRKTGVYLNSDIINSYQYRVKVKDNYNATNSTPGIVSIPVADDTAPTISTNGTFRIVESATNGDLVRTTSNGYSGTQARVTSNQSVTWSDDSGMISINSNGYISLSSDVNGVYTSGQSFTANVTATNSFGTTTTQSITINVVANGAPTITFTNQTSNFETDLALSGVTMVSMSVTDQESDTPYSASLTGTNASDLQLKYVGATSSSIGLQAASNLSAGTYTYNIKITDNFGKSTTYSSRSFTVTTSADYGKTYVYRSDYGSDSGLSSNYNAVMGASTVSGDTPPEVTAYTANATSPYRLISSSLGDASLSLAGGKTATRVAILSGSDLDTIISESNPFTMGNTAEQYLIIAPSGSDMVGIPTSMTDGFGDSTVGRYVMAIKADGGSWGQETSTVHLLDTSGSINGYDKHFVIGRNGHNAAASVEIRIIAASGSLPS